MLGDHDAGSGKARQRALSLAPVTPDDRYQHELRLVNEALERQGLRQNYVKEREEENEVRVPSAKKEQKEVRVPSVKKEQNALPREPSQKSKTPKQAPIS